MYPGDSFVEMLVLMGPLLVKLESLACIAKNTVISPKFLVWKFCEKV